MQKNKDPFYAQMEYAIIPEGDTQVTDEEKLWVAQARQGDDKAFSRLVETYQRPVFNV
jgi:hypothetical protein